MPFQRKSVRQLNICSRHTLFSKNTIRVDSLFDIGEDTNLLTGHEKAFYEDQRHAKEYRLSKEIDEGYVLKKHHQLKEEQGHLLKEVEEQSFMEDSDDENLPLDTSDRNLQQLDMSLSR